MISTFMTSIRLKRDVGCLTRVGVDVARATVPVMTIDRDRVRVFRKVVRPNPFYRFDFLGTDFPELGTGEVQFPDLNYELASKYGWSSVGDDE